MENYNSAKVEELTRMGFSLADVQKALKLCGTGSDAALNWLVDKNNQSHYETYNTQKAINDLNAFEPLNPEERIRVEGTPVGLKNIGNTCYFNSLIQTYFAIPAFVKAVMSFQIPQRVTSSKFQLLSQLQKLFALMIGSNRKYIDPTSVLSSITDDFGNKIEIGSQRDVGEFNMILVSRISEAMRNRNIDDEYESYRTSSGMMVNLDGLISNMFYGKHIESITFNEFGRKATQINHAVFGQINLDVEYGDLYTAWEFSKSTKIENFMTPSGSETTACQRVWIENPPSILLFHIQRVAYDKQKRSPIKINKRFEFPKVIHIDRFLYKNKQESKRQHKTLKNLRRQIKTMEETIDSITKYKNSGLGLPEILQLASAFIKEECSEDGFQQDNLRILGDNEVDSQTLKDLANWLAYLRNLCQTSMEKKKTELEKLRKELEQQYKVPGLMKTPYYLHSILIHEGSAEGGHYYSFIYDSERGIWRKYSDISVTEISEDEVMSISLGGDGSSSAYSLVYVDSKLKPEPKDTLYCSYSILSDYPGNDDYYTYLSAEMLNEIKAHNFAEWEQLNEFGANSALKEIQNLYTSRYTMCDTQYLSYESLKDKTAGNIMHELINFSVFLRIKGELMLCKWYILDTCVQEYYPDKGSLINYNKNDPIYLKLCQFFINSYNQAPKFIDLSPNNLKSFEKFKKEYKNVMKEAYITLYILNYLNLGYFMDALKSFVYQAQYPSAERSYYTDVMRDSQKVIILRMATIVVTDLESGRTRNAVEMIGHLTTITCFSLDRSDMHYRQIKIIVESIYADKERFRLDTEDYTKVKACVEAMNSGSCTNPTFDLQNFSEGFKGLLDQIENFDVCAWRNGWTRNEIASQFVETMNLFKRNYEKWYQLHRNFSKGYQKILSLKEYREI
ncbi:unnamed protein product [Blepharisma stoltei]|uniref:Ubiquitin carboxyl-terminal hydrolase n=1 Tax=Blepharisma stoltei TaxID=1481888 RepID=A0AAU9K4B0_9CILI|nr:unnamed protein product [Blepharisma stoltei]